MLLLRDFAASEGKAVTETAEGQLVSATPSCKGQRRLPIVVSAKILKFVIGGSFCVKGESALLMFAGERRRGRFRVICSHLNSSSVMH